MSDILYVVMSNGVPVDVSKYWGNATQSARQFDTPSKPATVVPVMVLEAVPMNIPDDKFDNSDCLCAECRCRRNPFIDDEEPTTPGNIEVNPEVT